MKKETSLEITELLGIVGLIVAMVGCAIWFLVPNKYERTRATALQVISRASDDNLPDSCEVDKDAWGHPMRYTRIPNAYQLTQVVTSAGRDGIFGTEDDEVVSETEYNWSRTAGRFVAEKSKDFVRGMVDGSSEPTKFSKYLPQTIPTSQPTVWQKLIGK